MILSQLPAPTKEHTRPPSDKPTNSSRALSNVGTALKEPPPYGSAERREYRPRKDEDFGDGGEDLPPAKCLELEFDDSNGKAP